MLAGTIRWYNVTKGMGFIIPHAAGPDVFIHASIVSGFPPAILRPGVRVKYLDEISDKGTRATLISIDMEQRFIVVPLSLRKHNAAFACLDTKSHTSELFQNADDLANWQHVMMTV